MHHTRHRSIIITVFAALFFCTPVANAQLNAYSGKQSDNNCKLIYLVNASDSIYYIAGLKQQDLNDCQTFSDISEPGSETVLINVSSNEKDYLLLLPKDTIAYNILISPEYALREKELSLLARNSPGVIGTNNDKRRGRQISRLPGRRIRIPILEK